MQCIGTVSTLFVKLPQAQTNSTVFFALELRSVPGTKRQVTKRPRDETACSEVCPRRNSWQESVPVTKRLAMKCTRDEMEAMKWQQLNILLHLLLTSAAHIISMIPRFITILSKQCTTYNFVYKQIY